MSNEVKIYDRLARARCMRAAGWLALAAIYERQAKFLRERANREQPKHEIVLS